MIILFILRSLIGLFFMVVSGDKLLQPYQNFLYVVQSYSLFPSFLEVVIAHVVPWVEFFLGLFLLSGLWLKPTLQAFMVMVGSFILLLLQAILRKLPLQDCGCFGGLWTWPVPGTLTMDIAIFVVLGIMLKQLSGTSHWSLDAYFAKPERRQ